MASFCRKLKAGIAWINRLLPRISQSHPACWGLHVQVTHLVIVKKKKKVGIIRWRGLCLGLGLGLETTKKNEGRELQKLWLWESTGTEIWKYHVLLRWVGVQECGLPGYVKGGNNILDWKPTLHSEFCSFNRA